MIARKEGGHVKTEHVMEQLTGTQQELGPKVGNLKMEIEYFLTKNYFIKKEKITNRKYSIYYRKILNVTPF